MSQVRIKLAALSEWSKEEIQNAIESTATELGIGMGKIGMPLRVAVTGQAQSPALHLTIHAIGQARTLARIEKALTLIASR